MRAGKRATHGRTRVVWIGLLDVRARLVSIGLLAGGARLVSIGLLACLSLACEGDGSGGESPRIEFRNSPECIRFAGGFPSGFDALPGDGSGAAVAQFIPTAVLGLDLNREPPALLANSAIPAFPEETCGRCGGIPLVDSDSDGEADACRSDALGFNCLSPSTGSLRALAPELVALSTSSYEQVVFVDPRNGRLTPIDVETPEASASFDPEDWPFWPMAGEAARRSALSTRACVYLPGARDSLGDPLGSNDFCDPTREGFVTRFTAGSAFSTGQLFVATSNLLRSSQARYAPGTVLVFQLDTRADPPLARPDTSQAVVLTSGYNPTTVTPYTTPAGRALLLVGVSGAVALGTGPDRVRTDSAVDVIDATSRTLIATVPLGLAGLGYSGLALDPTGRIALGGAATSRALFGIDLAALDDPTLGLGPEPLPIVLDGSTPGYPDARVYDAESPFVLPRRAGGPPDSQCSTLTSVAIASDRPRGVASDFCDGTLSVLALQLPALRTTPLDPATVVVVERLQEVAAPLVDDSIGLLRAIDRVQIRPGEPGVDFTGPDVHFTAGLPEGAVCGVRIDSL